jgi:hypothetical protein
VVPCRREITPIASLTNTKNSIRLANKPLNEQICSTAPRPHSISQDVYTAHCGTLCRHIFHSRDVRSGFHHVTNGRGLYTGRQASSTLHKYTYTRKRTIARNKGAPTTTLPHARRESHSKQNSTTFIRRPATNYAQQVTMKTTHVLSNSSVKPIPSCI